MNILRISKIYWYALLAIACAEVFSLAGWSWPWLGTTAFWVIIGATCLIAVRRLDIALWIVIAELVIGSKGYLFSMNIGSYSVSIRLGLFCVVVFIWLVTQIIKRRINFFRSKLFVWFMVFIAAIMGGIINGYFHDHLLKNIFLDANGFLYFGLIFVFYDVITNRRKISTAIEIIMAGVTGVAIKTICLLLLFASHASFLQSLYRWVRDTRVYEITLISHNFYRIFSQSQIYCLLLMIILLMVLIFKGLPKIIKDNRGIVYIYIATTTTILISYSRSFWLSIAITLMIMAFIIHKYYKFRIRKIFITGAIITFVFAAEVILILFIVNIPHWLESGGGGVSLSGLVEERLGDTNEVALQSRWNLIKPLTLEIQKSPMIGQGFGSEVTYITEDPRVVASTGGIYKTYSFEWGYLDLMLKIGIIGLFIYALFLYKIFELGINVYKKCVDEEAAIIIGFLLAFVSILVTHITTPYLNHPLGIGFIMFCAVIFDVFKKEHEQTENKYSAT